MKAKRATSASSRASASAVNSDVHWRSYSPELKPDEGLNADLSQAIGSKVPVPTRAKLWAAANEHMDFIAANPDRVRNYVQDPS